MKFSKDNQPQRRGRHKQSEKKIPMSVSVTPDVKEFYQQERGLAGRVLTNYKNNK